MPQNPTAEFKELTRDEVFEFRYRDSDEIVRREYRSGTDEKGNRFSSVDFKSSLDHINIVVWAGGNWQESDDSQGFRNKFRFPNGRTITIKIIDASQDIGK